MINRINISALELPLPVGTAVYSEAMQCATVRHTSCPAVAHFYYKPQINFVEPRLHSLSIVSKLTCARWREV